MLDIEAERNRVVKLFTQENSEILTSYIQRRAIVGNMDLGQVLLHVIPPAYNKEFFEEAQKLLDEVMNTLCFYDTIGDDVRYAFYQLQKFVARVDEAERLDEAHFLPIALEVFGKLPLPVTTEYVPYKKMPRAKLK